MSFVVTLACVFGLQQLQVRPVPAVVGGEVAVRALRDGNDLPGVAVEIELPDGSKRPCGATGAGGVVRFVPEAAGPHVAVATFDGVRTLAPFVVQPARARWPLALGSIPLGLALLWWNLSRARGRRAP